MKSQAPILVTGASGKTGQAVIQALIPCRQAVRAFCFRESQATALAELGAEVVLGDLLNSEDVTAAARGTRAIYHICPNMHPQEVAIGERIIQAAQAAGCQHLVYHSVLHPQTEAMPHHWHKLRVEEKLFESGLAITILQPTAYMQNTLASWRDLVNHGIYRVPYPAETRISLVDLDDVAEVAARVLTEPGHAGATYELAGPGFLSQGEVASTFARSLDRQIRVEAIPLRTWKSQARRAGLGDYQIETLAQMFGYYERFGLRGNPQVLGWLLDRVPTSFPAFVERVVKTHKPA